MTPKKGERGHGAYELSPYCPDSLLFIKSRRQESSKHFKVWVAQLQSNKDLASASQIRSRLERRGFNSYSRHYILFGLVTPFKRVGAFITF